MMPPPRLEVGGVALRLDLGPQSVRKRLAMASTFGKIRSRAHQGLTRWRLDFGRLGSVYSLDGEPFTSREAAELVLQAIRASRVHVSPVEALAPYLAKTRKAQVIHNVAYWQ